MAERPRARQKKSLKYQRFSHHCRETIGHAGTVPAQLEIGARPRLLRRNWWLNVLTVCLLTSCVVLPSTAEPPAAVAPILKIAGVSPPMYTTYPVGDPHQGSEFKVDQLSTQSLDVTNLYYYWYYDWNVTNPVLDTFSVCSDKPTCTIVLCDRSNNTSTDHTLLVVVSSAAQLDGAVTPTDFPPDAVWDAREWRIHAQPGSCQ